MQMCATAAAITSFTEEAPSIAITTPKPKSTSQSGMKEGAKKSRRQTAGTRRCGALRLRVLKLGMQGLPKSMRRNWWLNRILATPPWVDMKEIKRVYDEAHAAGMTVDHIIPLNHPRVCGLHVHWNLKAVPAAVNFSKQNAWCEWHGDLFSDPEQLSLF